MYPMRCFVASLPKGEKKRCCGDIDRYDVPHASTSDMEGATSNSIDNCDSRNE